MKWTIDHSNLPVFIRVDADGIASSKDNIALWSELLDLSDWKPGVSVLIDNRELEPPRIGSSQMIMDLTQFFIDRKDRIGSACIAIIRISSEGYAYNRQFEYGLRLRGSEVIVRNFSDENEAISWLSDCSDKEHRVEYVTRINGT
jgi:hypothetical protein